MLKKTAILMLFLMLLIPVGCAQNRQQADLENKIETSLKNENLKDVDADVKSDGRVELKGTVENEDQKQLAEQTARSVSGVNQVDNLIKVDYEQSAENRDKDTNVETEKVSEKKSPTNDTWLSFKTKLALYADKRVSGTDVDVEAHNGEITLIGKVPNEEAKKAAVQIAQKVNGVKKVNNELQVVPASERKVVDDKDDNITKNVDSTLEKDPTLKGLDLDVKTNNGVVTLTGEVDNMDQLEKAIQIVRNIKGVKAINANPVVITNNVNKAAKVDQKNKGSY